jgi:ABC-type oligopeptide transport system substrate-binding subunit
MRFKMLAGAALLSSAVALTACGTSTQSAGPSSQSPAMTSPAMTTAMAQGSSNARMGTFSGLNDKHVGGAVKVAGGQVTLSDFSSDPGPDLHIYLTNGTDENSVTAGKALGKIALDMPAQTFSAAGVDVSQYNTVVIHCDKAKAVFGAAALA